VAVVFGLGNPGPRYAGSRHNAGFRVVERLAGRWGAGPGEAADRYRCWRAVRGAREVALVQPLTWMNASGSALEEWRERHGLEPAALLVVVDDVYLPLGALRLRSGGSSGGHRGLESIEAALPGSDYARLRIGVGAAAASAELREHVLETFAPDEREPAAAALERAADAVECWVDQGIVAAMNRFNRNEAKEASEP
jgi:peptidyl-tRNA hydrolase, PTH1 family